MREVKQVTGDNEFVERILVDGEAARIEVERLR